jgi:hypothetical protein
VPATPPGGAQIGYRYGINLLPDCPRLTPFLEKHMQIMGWADLSWLEDVHMGFEEDRPGGFRLQYQRLSGDASARGVRRCYGVSGAHSRWKCERKHLADSSVT